MRTAIVAGFAVLSLAIPGLASELWRGHEAVESLDLYYGSGGRALVPRPPFRFVDKDQSGTSKKVIVRDASSRIWEVKFGPEVHAEVFATRIAWALGYHTDPTYFVPSGIIGGKVFQEGRFELRDPALKYRPDLEWTWKKNPFVGRRELNGLRILVMLLSDWDNKDARDRGSNLGVLEHRSSGGRTYYVNDWGGSMGRWGNYFTREKWDCEGYREQTPNFVKGVDQREVEWGFSGQHNNEFKEGITVADVRWLMAPLGRLTDAQIRTALRASGADRHEIRCFTRSLRHRITQLRQVANNRHDSWKYTTN